MMQALQMSYRHTITGCITNNAFNSLLLNEKLSFSKLYLFIINLNKIKGHFPVFILYSIQMNSIQMDTIIAVNASILEKTNSEKIESTYNTCIVHERQQQWQQYNQPPRFEDKNALLPVSLRFLPNSYFRNRNSLSTTIAADLGVLHKNHESLDQLLEHFDRSCEMMSSEDQEQKDATVTDASITTSLPIALSSLSSSIMTPTTFDNTNTASTAKSSLKRKIRIANDDDSDNEIVFSSTQRRCDDNYQRSNNNSPKRMKRMKYARRNSVVIRDSKQLSQIATDLSTISKN